MGERPSVLGAITRGTYALGIAMIGLGVLVALAPALAGAPVVIVVGVLVALAGGVLVVFGWRSWSGGKGPFGLLAGGLAVACGLALLLNPVSTLGTVSSLVAIYMVVDGAAALFSSSQLDENAGRSWVLAHALLSIGLGVSMWVGWPFSELRALGLLLGLKLVSAGAVVLRVERGMRRVGAGMAALRSRLEG